jgi:hypothetical protein
VVGLERQASARLVQVVEGDGLLGGLQRAARGPATCEPAGADTPEEGPGTCTGASDGRFAFRDGTTHRPPSVDGRESLLSWGSQLRRSNARMRGSTPT